jgi:hypothetical protein
VIGPSTFYLLHATLYAPGALEIFHQNRKSHLC